uniref:Uncharacterized protein n=1 Tax=Glossina pallidipes TaxID=7398 RepID=A0A1A9Z208_GLOPL
MLRSDVDVSNMIFKPHVHMAMTSIICGEREGLKLTAFHRDNNANAHGHEKDIILIFVTNSPSHKYSPGVISSTFYFIFNFNQFNHCAKQPISSKPNDDTNDTSTN